VKDIAPGSVGGSPASLVAFNGALYFEAPDSTHGVEPWKYVPNHSPVLGTTSGNLVNIPVNINNEANTGILVADLLSSMDVADSDGWLGNIGIAVNGSSSTYGTWQYNTGSGWTDFGTLSGPSAQLLSADDHVRFVPNGDTETASLTFRAWDETDGLSGGETVSITGVGGPSPYGSQTGTASITVTA
jgi:dipeptidyl aminopeptidase/acylaminoacyl peptidase